MADGVENSSRICCNTHTGAVPAIMGSGGAGEQGIAPVQAYRLAEALLQCFRALVSRGKVKWRPGKLENS